MFYFMIALLLCIMSMICFTTGFAVAANFIGNYEKPQVLVAAILCAALPWFVYVGTLYVLSI